MDQPIKTKSVVVALIVGLAILAFVFYYPRFLIDRLGESNPWTSYLYQYGFGLVFFVVGLCVILGSGACKLGRGRDTFWFGVLLAGFVGFATLHAVWIVAAQQVPYLGG